MFRVLEVGGNWSGPMVGQYLRALGCDVIRLESPKHPDAVRLLPAPRIHGEKVPGAVPADNPYFAQINAEKRSVEVDLDDVGQRRAAQELAASCDIVVENLSPGAVDRIGLSYGLLSPRNPALCMLSLPALHPGDPWESLRGYAPVFTAMGGLDLLVGYPDEPTGTLMTGWGDPAGAIVGLAGLLAAVNRRARTGLGSYVICSQLKAITWQMVQPFSEWRSGETGRPGEGDWSRVVPTQDPAAWVVTVGRAATRDEALRQLGLANLEQLDEWARARAAVQVVTALETLDLSTALVHRAETSSDTNRVRRRGICRVEEHPMLGPIRRYAVPWLFEDGAPFVAGGAPALGEHTAEVMGAVRPSPPGRAD